MFSAATSGVHERFQGLASGIATSGQQIGGAVGLAALVAVSNAVSGASLTPAQVSTGLQAAVFTASALVVLTIGAAVALRKRPQAQPTPIDSRTTQS